MVAGPAMDTQKAVVFESLEKCKLRKLDCYPSPWETEAGKAYVPGQLGHIM